MGAADAGGELPDINPDVMLDLLTRAEGSCRQALAIDPGHAGALSLLGCVLWQGGNADCA